jgi:myo-inositol-1-phosphate synthase
MTTLRKQAPTLLLMAAGAKGAIASTVAAAVAESQTHSDGVLQSLTTSTLFPSLGGPHRIRMVGWDTAEGDMLDVLRRHGVVPPSICQANADFLTAMEVRTPPAQQLQLAEQVEAIGQDMRDFMAGSPEARPVWVNLLPAACDIASTHPVETLSDLWRIPGPLLPDLAYTIAALLAGIPIVNFTPNTIELPIICQEALMRCVPLAGRDGKTGQTYFKVVLASAFKARSLYVDGWYSLNILGNSDGKNLMDPERACGKLNNKTRLLDEILQYPVGERYDTPTHKVHIDYYPPRGDAKEAWDVIDFTGLFGLPMSLRLNLQGRDSILAAPMVIDLARWAAALKGARIGGPIADLGFFFKKPVGPNPPLTFQDQLAALDRLALKISHR